MSYDLLLQRAGTRRNERDANAVLEALTLEVPEANELQPLRGPVEPDEDDCAQVEEIIDDQPDAAVRFRRFCEQRGVGVKEALRDSQMCAEFLDQEEPVTLVTVSIPFQAGRAERIYAAVIAFAKRHGLSVLDPQFDRVIDLDNPGSVPPTR